MSLKKNNTSNISDWGLRGTAGVSFAAAISFDEVVVSLGGKNILDALSFNLIPGEVICLLGESGSGKSTILRAIAGIQTIKSGTISINNIIVSSAKKTLEPQKRGVGMMFQDFALFPHLSLLENVLFGLSHLSRKEALAQARGALSRVGLLDREKDFPHMLSGGQQQRLALARTIAPRPSIILLDEPFSGLDSRMRENIRTETMAVLREINATTIIVTHDPEEAMLLGDRIILLRNGKLAQIDSVDNIYNRPVDLEAARFLSPLSEIPSVVNNGFANTPLGPVPAKKFKEKTKVTVALRPTGAIEIRPNDKVYGQGSTVLGRVISKTNALGIDICEIEVAAVERPIKVRARANSDISVGNNVYLSLNCKHVLVFD
jgi:iron(III) transport system ATP-binding protein